MGFAPDILELLRTTEEVRIETRQAPDAPAHRTTIWVVVDDAERVLIRSYLGREARWFREVVAHPECALWIGTDAIPVHAEPATDPDRVAAASAGLEAKYPDDPATPRMVRDEVLETTLELLPR